MPLRHALIAAAALTLLTAAHAQTTAAVEARNAWVRASVPGQSGTGAFMTLTAKEGLRLVGATSPVAGVVEVHEMRLEGDVMRMRALPGLDLPAGKPVDLKPGGYHVMLLDLKSALAKDSSVPLTLRFTDAKGAASQLDLTVPVAAAAPGAAAGHGAHKH